MGELSWIYEVKRRVSLFQIRKGERVTCVDGITEEMIDGKSLKECRNIIDSALINKWQHAWEGNSKDRVTYAWIKKCKEY